MISQNKRFKKRILEEGVGSVYTALKTAQRNLGAMSIKGHRKERDHQRKSGADAKANFHNRTMRKVARQTYEPNKFLSLVGSMEKNHNSGKF